MVLKTFNINSIFIFIVHSFALYCDTPYLNEVVTHIEKINDVKQKISFKFTMTKNDFLYKDFINFSVAHPLVTLSDWSVEGIPQLYYDPLFKGTKYIFKRHCTISVIITAEKAIFQPVFLYFSYYQRSRRKIEHLEQELYFSSSSEQNFCSSSSIETNVDIDQQTIKTQSKSSNTSPVDNYKALIKSYIVSCGESFTNTYSLHVFFIVLLFILCVIPPYFFTKTLHASIQLFELIRITTATSFFVLINYCIYYIRLFLPSYFVSILIVISTFFIGVFYIKKSTSLQWSCLRTLCSFIGIGLIAISVLILFKAMQSFTVVF